MKRVLLASFVLFIFAIACAPTPTPQIATATPAPSVPASNTATLQIAQTILTPTSTETRLAPTPTATQEIPLTEMRVWKEFDYSGGWKGAGYVDGRDWADATNLQGPAFYTFKLDDTGLFRDANNKPRYVLFAEINRLPSESDKVRDDIRVRAYPVFRQPFTDQELGSGMPIDHAYEFDTVVMPTNEPLGPPPGGNNNIWLSIESSGIPNQMLSGTGLITTMGKPFLELYTVVSNNISHRMIAGNPPEFPLGQKVRVRKEYITQSGKIYVRLFQGNYDKSRGNFLGFQFIQEAPLYLAQMNGMQVRTALYSGYKVGNLGGIKLYNANMRIFRK